MGIAIVAYFIFYSIAVKRRKAPLELENNYLAFYVSANKHNKAYKLLIGLFDLLSFAKTIVIGYYFFYKMDFVSVYKEYLLLLLLFLGFVQILIIIKDFNKVMRYTYSQTMSQYFYTCRRCKTRIYHDDLKYILTENIKGQITKINDVEVISYNEKNIKIIKRNIKLIEVKIQKYFEDYTKGDITEEKLKVTIEELTKEKNKLTLNVDKGLKQTKTVLSQVSR